MFCRWHCVVIRVTVCLGLEYSLKVSDVERAFCKASHLVGVSLAKVLERPKSVRA